MFSVLRAWVFWISHSCYHSWVRPDQIDDGRVRDADGAHERVAPRTTDLNGCELKPGPELRQDRSPSHDESTPTRAALPSGAALPGIAPSARSRRPNIRRNARPASSRTMYDVGTRISVMSVANSTPKPSDTRHRHHERGVEAPVLHQRREAEEGGERLSAGSAGSAGRPPPAPPARGRPSRTPAGPAPACLAMRLTSVWVARARLMKSTMIRLSLTTTPVSATSPNITSSTG